MIFTDPISKVDNRQKWRKQKDSERWTIKLWAAIPTQRLLNVYFYFLILFLVRGLYAFKMITKMCSDQNL